MVDSRGPLGGVCLNVGCIPSKALLHAAKVIAETKEMSHAGLTFTAPTIDLDALRGWKDSVVTRLTGGLTGLAKQRKVTTLVGTGTFTSPNMLSVAAPDGSTTTVSFDAAIIAAGSEPVTLPFIPHDDPRVIDSTGALDLDNIPERLLVLGGGIIGLEMACVYSELGTKISVVELMDQLIPGADKDLVTPLTKRIAKDYEAIWLGTKVTADHRRPRRPHRHPRRHRQQGQGQGPRDRDLRQGAGRRRTPPQRPRRSAPTHAGVFVDERGFIPVDKQQRTNVAHIFAIGDVVGQPMLAHKATHEGKVAAENTAGHTSYFDATVIPSRRLHRPRSRLGRRHRERSQSRRGQIRQRRVPLGRLRPLPVPGPRRRPHQSPVRRDHRPRHRRRHRRPQRRRPHRRSRPRHRDGLRRRATSA